MNFSPMAWWSSRQRAETLMPRKAPVHRPYKPKTPMHNARGRDATDRQRRRAMHTGSKGWKLQRARVLARDEYTCRQCGRFGDQVDHINSNAHVLVTDDELQTLCLICHSAKTMREMNAHR